VIGGIGATLAALYLGLQVLVPLRFVLYPGNVNWTEEGFRFAWRVMLIEKSGQVEFEVVNHNPPRRWVVYPRSELTPLQYKMMSTQPDMIHEYALHLAERYRRQGYPDVEVRAQAWAALNGRPSQRLIDPAVDLAREPRSLLPKSWIVPLGSSCPPSGATLSSLRCH
jgi:vitamin K-dependent gamma-carboxylase